MNKVLSLAISCLMFASLALAQANSGENRSVSTAVGAPNKAFIQEILNAWSTMDLSVVGKYYNHAPTNVFYDVAPVKYEGWTQYADGVHQFFSTLKSINFSANDDVTVHHAGKLAWGTSTVKMVMTDKSGKVTSANCRWTIVWEKRGNDWLIVHDHFSVPTSM